jgi:DNA-binding response OmpR family regulator
VVLDLILPKADGFEVLRALRESDSRTPVIIATAKPRQSVEPDVKDKGVEAILSKPLDFGVLTDLLQQAISKSAVSQVEEAMENRVTGKKYPFRVSRKCYAATIRSRSICRSRKGTARIGTAVPSRNSTARTVSRNGTCSRPW